MKFAHLSDCHLGGWRQPELEKLNLESFKKAIDICVNEKVEFVLFTGDLFDSAFPSIDVLKETFAEFRKLKEAGIKSYLIAGSHDYSVSGKTFLDVLEKSGFCEISKYDEEREGDEIKSILLKPSVHQSTYIYGYPGKKSGLEVQDLRKIKINEPYENNFRILMLHTTIKDVAENLPIDSINLEELPKSDYYALGHIHIDFEKEYNGKPVIYSGPTFPNNFKEFEELKYGSFYIIEVEGYTKITKKEIKLKEVELVEINLDNALNGTERIISELETRDLNDKIVLLKIKGVLKQGKLSDIKFSEIQKYLETKNIYSFLKNTSKLEIEKPEMNLELESKEMEKIEEGLIKEYKKTNTSKFNKYIPRLIESLSLEKQEGEKSANFEFRLISELNKIFELNL